MDVTGNRGVLWCVAFLIFVAAILSFVAAGFLGVDGVSAYLVVVVVLIGLALCCSSGLCCLIGYRAVPAPKNKSDQQ